MKSLATSLMAVVSLLTVAPLASPNLITNGSFETPSVLATGFTNFQVDTGLLTDWTIFGPTGTAVSIFIVSGLFSQNGVSCPAQAGSQWLDPTGDGSNSTEGVSQVVTTTVGDQYQLSFFIGNTTGGSTFGWTSTVDVLLNGSLAFADTNTTTSPTTLSWELFSHTFIAGGALTTIGFRNTEPARDNTDGLDNVVLIDLGPPGTVPEPSTLFLFGSGLAGLGGFAPPGTIIVLNTPSIQ